MTMLTVSGYRRIFSETIASRRGACPPSSNATAPPTDSVRSRVDSTLNRKSICPPALVSDAADVAGVEIRWPAPPTNTAGRAQSRRSPGASAANRHGGRFHSTRATSRSCGRRSRSARRPESCTTRGSASRRDDRRSCCRTRRRRNSRTARSRLARREAGGAAQPDRRVADRQRARRGRRSPCTFGNDSPSTVGRARTATTAGRFSSST